MSDKIALTSSMRSNLLSLKNTQKLMDTTQDRLSSGYRVNSAMDNPSSYFTAQALNSRASDLSTLLDSIGQAISTLEVADEGITTLQDFVEQAKSIANSARDTANVASKVTSDNVTFNAATAKTDKLTDLIANIEAGDEFTIRMGEATKMEGSANVSEDQKLSEIGIKNGAKIEMIVGNKTYEFSFADAAVDATVDANGVTKQTFAVDSTLEDFMSEVVYTVGRKILNADVVGGKLSFNTMDNSSLTIRSTADFATGENAKSKDVTLKVTGETIKIGETSITIAAAADNTAYTADETAAIVDQVNSALKDTTYQAVVKANGQISVYNTADTATAPTTVTATTTPTEGTAAIQTNFNKTFGFDEGYTVTLTKDMTVEQFRQAVDGLEGISADFDSKGHLVISGDQGDDMIIVDKAGDNFVRSLLGDNVVSATNGSNERAKYAKQFDGVLDQIDQLVQDTSYKGINLLNGDNLTVVFNESRTSTLELKGVTFDAVGLGFTTSEAEWKDNANIDKSLDQITKATSLLRAQASEFGQNLSTVQIREDFTENMINNLQSGADKLTLADMNEEAANMLALQTRQQLGVNSLSLASQASQSVLKLF